MNLFKYKAVIVSSLILLLLFHNLLTKVGSSDLLVYLIIVCAGNVFFSSVVIQIVFDDGHVYMDKRHRNTHIAWYVFLISMGILFIYTHREIPVIILAGVTLLLSLYNLIKEITGEKTRIRRVKRWESKNYSKKHQSLVS